MAPLETEEVIPARYQTANVDNQSYLVRIRLNIEHGGRLMMLTHTLFWLSLDLSNFEESFASKGTSPNPLKNPTRARGIAENIQKIY
jgi:hypothetical protein